MKIEATTRRANFWLFVGLVVFAILLCALVFGWMRVRTHAEGGKVYPPVTIRSVGLSVCRATAPVAAGWDAESKGARDGYSLHGEFRGSATGTVALQTEFQIAG